VKKNKVVAHYNEWMKEAAKAGAKVIGAFTSSESGLLFLSFDKPVDFDPIEGADADVLADLFEKILATNGRDKFSACKFDDCLIAIHKGDTRFEIRVNSPLEQDRNCVCASVFFGTSLEFTFYIGYRSEQPKIEEMAELTAKYVSDLLKIDGWAPTMERE
jgi:hypothetical protein